MHDTPCHLGAVSDSLTVSGWHRLVRFVAGAALVLSGFISAAGSLGYLGVGQSGGDSIWVAETKIAIGAFISTGIFYRLSRWLAVAVYGAFLAYQFYVPFSNAGTTCGCFGTASTSFGLVGAFDAFALLSLLFVGTAMPKSLWARRCAQCSAIAMSAAFVVILWQTVPTVVGPLLDRHAADGFDANPERWVGSTFPLLDIVDIQDDLSHGHWGVVLYRQRCTCDAASIERRFPSSREAIAMEFAAIRVPIDGDSSGVRSSLPQGVREGSLISKVPRNIFAPVYLELLDGVVVSAQR